MTVLFWILMVFLLLVFIAKISDACNNNHRVEIRYADLLVGVVAFVIMNFLKCFWR